MLTEEQAVEKVNLLGRELDRRSMHHGWLDAYFTGRCPLPSAVTEAKVTKAYRMLMHLAQTPYARLIVKAATSRMELGGIRTGDKALDKDLWVVWQASQMDAEFKRATDSVLTDGRAFAVVWPDADDVPRITMEDEATVVVEYEEGSRYRRVAALRRWVDDQRVRHATLYDDTAVYKFTGGQGTDWKPRRDDKEWPLPNPFGVVPVVEVATNRRLCTGRYGSAAGDFESAVGLLDRINTLEFLRLVIAFTQGFPIRAVIGDKILRDDDGNPLAPFELAADVIAQFENPNVKIEQVAAADLKAFGDAIDHDVEALAGITQTPAYYLRSVPIQNVSADAIRASDAPLNARVEDHKPEIGEGAEEVLRVVGRMLPGGVEVPQTAEVWWVNRELRSLSERSDAAVKLATVLPWQAVLEIAFDATQEEINRWTTMRALEVALQPPPAAPAQLPAPQSAPLNGNGLPAAA